MYTHTHTCMHVNVSVCVNEIFVERCRTLDCRWPSLTDSHDTYAMLTCSHVCTHMHMYEERERLERSRSLQFHYVHYREREYVCTICECVLGDM